MSQHGFDETAFWFIPTILLLVFFSYFTYKIFIKKEFIEKWKITLKTTTIGSIVFGLIIGLISLIMYFHTSSHVDTFPGEGGELAFMYAVGISFLSLLFAFILIIMISISFYKDFKIAKSNKVKKA